MHPTLTISNKRLFREIEDKKLSDAFVVQNWMRKCACVEYSGLRMPLHCFCFNCKVFTDWTESTFICREIGAPNRRMLHFTLNCFSRHKHLDTSASSPSSSLAHVIYHRPFLLPFFSLSSSVCCLCLSAFVFLIPSLRIVFVVLFCALSLCLFLFGFWWCCRAICALHNGAWRKDLAGKARAPMVDGEYKRTVEEKWFVMSQYNSFYRKILLVTGNAACNVYIMKNSLNTPDASTLNVHSGNVWNRQIKM